MPALPTMPSSAPLELISSDWDPVVAPVRDFLERVSVRLEDQVIEFESEIQEYARYALENQGKQLRPTLVALCGGSVGEVTEESVTIAAIIEMIHLATLVHDDIMDEALVRRRRPTLANRWGNGVAVLLGDCLFAHALKLASGLSSTEICKLVATSSERVCAGEILQSHRRRRWSLDRPDYFKVIEMKTAELFALACDLGSRLSGGTSAEIGALRRYGLALGTAYQIYDDCLDLFGAESVVGKSLGTDLSSGKVTLPLIVCLEQCESREREELIASLNSWEPAKFQEIRLKLEQCGALNESRRVIAEFLNAAESALSEIKPGPEIDALLALNCFLARQTALLAG